MMIGYTLATVAGSSLLAWSTPAQALQLDLDQCYTQQTQLSPFSGVLLLDTGERIFTRSTGTADAEGLRPITSATPFRLASVQKVFTRVAVGRLVDRGDLDLDAPIARYLPDLPAAMAGITVRQLLEHRSGVSAFTRMTPADMDLLVRARTATDLVPLLTSRPLEFEPGTQDAYSNGGYWLVGALIEAISAQTYEQFLNAEIYHPLSMNDSGLAVTPETAVRKTRMAGPGQSLLSEPMAMRPPREPLGSPAGDGISTAEDMLKFGQALLGNSLLSDGVKAQVFPRQPSGPWRIGQSGGTAGTNTEFAVFPEIGEISITLSNFDPPAADLVGRVLREAGRTGACATLRPEDLPQRRPPSA